jgi:predicted enzyme involved in methoxymalonyl-ACP biosynthesis
MKNMVYFIEELNNRLYTLCKSRTNIFMIDFDQIVSTYGRKYLQEDQVTHFNHGGRLFGIALAGDEFRLEPLGDLDLLYRPSSYNIITTVYHEAVGAYRTIIQENSIKIVIFDLDDTLWRGVAAERDALDAVNMTEGWPLGIWRQ